MAARSQFWAIAFGATLAVALLAGPTVDAAWAGDAAVSDVNFKVSGFGGQLNPGDGARGLGGIAASLTLPAGHSFGLQFDGAFAKVGGDDFYDAGAHLFWRDPGQGLFGLYAGYAHLNTLGGLTTRRIGVETERYSGKLTFEGAVGYENGDAANGVYGHAKLDYYWTPNLMTSSGFTYEGAGYYSSKAEYQIRSDDSASVSLFANSDWHANDNYQVLGGLKIAFGKSMSLIDRHRKQDPANYLDPDLIAGAQAQAANRAGVTTNAIPACAIPSTFNDPGSCSCPAADTQPSIEGSGFDCVSPV